MPPAPSEYDERPKSGRHNIMRTYRMRQKSLAELNAILAGGSLAWAAAEYELRRRDR